MIIKELLLSVKLEEKKNCLFTITCYIKRKTGASVNQNIWVPKEIKLEKCSKKWRRVIKALGKESKALAKFIKCSAGPLKTECGIVNFWWVVWKLGECPSDE